MTGTRISKLLIQFTILFICSCSLSAQGKYGGGTGEPNDPYLIFDANHMNAIGADANDWDKHFILMADIDLGEYMGDEFNIIGKYVDVFSPDNKPFTGVFDGNGHTLSNFTHDSNDKDYIGLFGYVGIGGEIKDVGMIDADVNAETGNYVSSLVGYLENGTINNCHTEGVYIAGGKYIGAMVGRNSGFPGGTGRIVNCDATGVVNGNYMTGGLVGSIYLGWLSDCNSAVTVVGNEYTGGLVGWNSSLSIVTNCFATGTVDGNSSTGGLLGSAGALVSNCYATGDVNGIDYTGGLIGDCEFQISATNCHATGSVNGTNYTGGLVGIGEGFSNCYTTGDVNGFNNTGGFAGSGGYIWNSYASGNVNGDSNTGGLLGNVSMTISNCYASGAVSGNDNIGGLVGYDQPHFITSYTKCFWDNGVNPDLDGIGNIIDPTDVIGESTENMKTESTFTDAGWDFINVWNIGENQTYPYLRRYLAGDINKDGIVNFFDFAIEADQWLEEYYFGNRPPRVLITYPEDGARLMVGGVPPQTMIWAEANDYDGTVVRVEFFVDDLKLGDDTDGSDGWRYLWQNYSLGFHVLTAAAWDNEGLSGMSTPVNVEVWMPDPPPP